MKEATLFDKGEKSGSGKNVESTLQYKKQSYWENRFQCEEQYEWLCNYSDVKEYICRDVRFDDKILVLGCGNSTFSADLYDAGFKNVTSVDFSTIVIDSMKKKYQYSHPSLKWIVSDVRNLEEIEDATFDLVIDKACLDALVCDEGDPWRPNEETTKDVQATLCSVVRVLNHQSNAKFISIGFQQPHFRKLYLISDNTTYGWEDNVKTFPINVGLGYFYTRCICVGK